MVSETSRNTPDNGAIGSRKWAILTSGRVGNGEGGGKRADHNLKTELSLSTFSFIFVYNRLFNTKFLAAIL